MHMMHYNIIEFIYFRGCFLTSSLIATSALSLVTPLSMIADVVIKGVSYCFVLKLYIINPLPIEFLKGSNPLSIFRTVHYHFERYEDDNLKMAWVYRLALALYW